jgi:hypothetical protein
MTRYCKICGQGRSNESFCGKGLRSMVCKQCRKLPKEQQRLALWTDEVYGFLEQSNISAKNIQRLKELYSQPDNCLSDLAATVLEIAELYPRKKKRCSRLKSRHRQLFRKALELGLCEDLSSPWEYELENELEDDLEGVWIESSRPNDRHLFLDLDEYPP